MSHQGNIYLSYNLALIVRVFSDFQEDFDNGKIDEQKIEAYVSNESLKHLQKRFNKTSDVQKSAKIEAVFKNRVVFKWINASPGGNLPIIGKRAPACAGKVFVLFYACNAKVFDEHIRGIESELRLQDAEIHIEHFHIDPAHADVAEKDRDKFDDNVYHLASRVCGTFLEYVTNFTDGVSLPFGLEGNEICVIKALKVIEADKQGKASPIQQDSVVKKIMDIRDAVDLICEGLDGKMNFFPPVPRHMSRIFEGKHFDDPAVWVRYKFPFGVWFRGQSRVCFGLSPSLFRERMQPVLHDGCQKERQTCVMYDESSLVHHFMLHKPEFRKDYHDLFEWLCLMQHYDAPSRVLDWTESMLTALYFAVCDPKADCDGAVWVLNAGRLNEITRVSTSRRYVCMPNSLDVLLRSAMAISHTGPELKTTIIKQGHWEELKSALKHEARFLAWLDGDRKVNIQKSKIWHKLAYPVAVFPGHINERVANQQATFTLHGGKLYDEKVPNIPERFIFPMPKGLISLSKEINDGQKDAQATSKNALTGKPFLDVYIVPSCAKRKLREQLKRLGVHIASVYPELEYQAQYIKHQWRFEAPHK